MTDFSLILRMFDFMISTQNQHVGLYMVAAVLLVHKKKLRQKVQNLTDFTLFTRNEIELEDENSIQTLMDKCYQIMQSESKERRRKELWKSQKMEIAKTLKRFKRTSKKVGLLIHW